MKEMTIEEIEKALDFCYSSPCCGSDCPYFNKHGRNFCVEDKALYKDMKRIVLEHAEQKAEIERLTELQSRGAYRVAELGIENAELQKQVDDLNKERNDLLHERQMAFMDGQQQAVKDIAPVAINRFINQLHIDGVLRDEGDLSNELRKVKAFVLKRYYGVEVE